jgi:hypothetical protein
MTNLLNIMETSALPNVNSGVKVEMCIGFIPAQEAGA